MGEKKFEFKSISDKFTDKYNKNNMTKSIPTGFKEYDEILEGGFKVSETNIIAADSGVGKTTTALNCAVRQARLGYKVLFLSLEMKEEKLYERILAILFEDKVWKWKLEFTGELDDDAFKKKQEAAKKAIDRELKGNLYIEDKKYTAKEIIEIIKEANNQGFDIIYCDNYQIITSGMKHEQIVSISEEIRETVRETNLAFVHLSQITMNGPDPAYAGIHNGHKLKHDCANLTVIYRKFEVLSKEEIKDGVKPKMLPDIYFYIQKNRYGRNAVELEMRYDASIQTIGEFIEKKELKKEKEETDLHITDIPTVDDFKEQGNQSDTPVIGSFEELFSGFEMMDSFND
jgi:ATP:corrinoid adenosyltransferase